MPFQPILLNSCAKAATAAEARFRITRPIAPARSVCVVALDRGAEPMMRRTEAHDWASARFFTCRPRAEGEPPDDYGAELMLQTFGGARSKLSDELVDADIAVMIATNNHGAATAAVIGQACARRSIMTAGLVLGAEHPARAAIAALRPYARVLMATDDEDDVVEVLRALRA